MTDDTVLDEGTLELVDNLIDESTGTLRLKASFPGNKDFSLWPGQYVSGRDAGGKRKRGPHWCRRRRCNQKGQGSYLYRVKVTARRCSPAGSGMSWTRASR